MDFTLAEPANPYSVFTGSAMVSDMTTLHGGDMDNGSTTTVTPVTTTVFLPWNNPRNIISREMYLRIDYSMFCVTSPILFLIGVPTNIVNLIVFFRQGIKDRMNLCLFCLSFVDLWFVFLFTICQSSPCFVEPGVTQALIKFYMRIYLTGIYRGFLFSSGLITMIISIERCLCVFAPMKAAILMNTKTMGVLVAGVMVSLQALCVQYPLKLSISSLFDPATKSTSYFLSTTQLYKDHTEVFDILENTVIMTAIPFATFIIVVIATALTVIQLKRATAWRKMVTYRQPTTPATTNSTSTTGNSQDLANNSGNTSRTANNSSSNNSKERGLVVMLVTVSCIFIVTASPNIALGLTRTLVYDFWHTRAYSNIFLATHTIYLVLGQFNSSINFFVYVARSSRYRQELAVIFPCLRRWWGGKSFSNGKVPISFPTRSKAVASDVGSDFKVADVSSDVKVPA